MVAFFRRGPGIFTATLGVTFWILAAVAGGSDGSSPQLPRSSDGVSQQAAPRPAADARPARLADFDRMLREQADTDRTWQAASAGFMRMEKITYRSSVGDLDIPAFVFEPLENRGYRFHPALIWVHENIRGHLYEHYIPYVREAVARGYVVIAPEYRGSIGYGKDFYDAIDYGGAEVDDVVSAVDVLKTRYPEVDPQRIGIIGWSHGGMIALLGVARNPATFRAAAALVPVSNLFQRLASKGVDAQRQAIDPQNRFGGAPWERPEIYRDRSPLFHVDDFQIPLLVHLADNDEDVNIEEGMQLVDALHSRKPDLTRTMVYSKPPGGHLFDRRVTPGTWEPENTPAQVDSWDRVWSFFESCLTNEKQKRPGTRASEELTAAR